MSMVSNTCSAGLHNFCDACPCYCHTNKLIQVADAEPHMVRLFKVAHEIFQSRNTTLEERYFNDPWWWTYDRPEPKKEMFLTHERGEEQYESVLLQYWASKSKPQVKALLSSMKEWEVWNQEKFSTELKVILPAVAHHVPERIPDDAVPLGYLCALSSHEDMDGCEFVACECFCHQRIDLVNDRVMKDFTEFRAFLFDIFWAVYSRPEKTHSYSAVASALSLITVAGARNNSMYSISPYLAYQVRDVSRLNGEGDFLKFMEETLTHVNFALNEKSKEKWYVK